MRGGTSALGLQVPVLSGTMMMEQVPKVEGAKERIGKFLKGRSFLWFTGSLSHRYAEPGR